MTPLSSNWNPNGPRIGHIDGDLIVFSGCAAHENDDTFDGCKEYLDNIIVDIRDKLDLDDFTVYVTAGGNFRRDVYPEYKANRTSRPKPKWLGDAYKYLYSDWAAKAVRQYEADDLLGIALTENPDHILISYDKDLDQIPGWHYNFRRYEMYNVDEASAQRFLAIQCLAGDMVDNIPGIRGIGPKKAEAILGEGIQPLPTYLEKVIEAYYQKEMTFETFAMYYKCLKILRKPELVWPELRELPGYTPEIE